ncbi:MAG: YwiC-like family protein [Planctomycetota bacterium]
MPREHGTWAQLLIPLTVALASGETTAAAWLFAASACLAFTASEPARVLLGHRGLRRLRGQEALAARNLGITGSAAVAAGALALAIAPESRVVALIPLAMCVPVLLVLQRHRERTVAGESLVAIVLCLAALPSAVITIGPLMAAGCIGSLAIGFVLATVAVKGVIAHRRRPTPLPIRVLRVASVAVVWACVCAMVPREIAIGLICALPISLLPITLWLFPPHPRHIRRIGWSLAAASILSAGLMIAALRVLQTGN